MIEFQIAGIDEDEDEDIGIDELTHTVTLYARVSTIEYMFTQLDKGLHGKKTYDYLEDKNYGLEIDLEEKQEIIDMYREQAEEKGGRF